ncbi:MAG: Asp-tRNA(Asn)/Glu-tRNA(Gln) amidotransferase subunit GatA [Alphaproteobacteria bacterium]|nr:Asp-tRNA(Asn)/Glu-tRNA(Gln) amidotransferase subunit GatA [Alphaproteobacteria bacterium]
MPSEPTHVDLVELADQVRARKLSAVEVAEASLARIADKQPELNCFISLDADGAMRAARAVDARIARGEDPGPLAGVPLAHKDMFYRQGRISTCGSKIRRQWVADNTATALTRLDAAGALDLGGLNMTEFAVGPTGHNLQFGACRNPWNTSHSPGGSSAGSGAAVAARLVHGSLGSDTGGSIRLPSAFNGVTGMKPTQTRVSRHAVMPLSGSFDCVGPLARSARDVARLMSVLAGHDPLDSTSSRRPSENFEAACELPVKGPKVGLPTSYYTDGLDPALERALTVTGKVLAAMGCALVEVPVPAHEPLNMLWQIILSAEAATIHRRWLIERPGDYNPQVKRRIELGLYLPATRYLEAMDARDRLTREFAGMVFSRCDVLLTPGTPVPAPTLDELDVGASDKMPELILKLSAFTRPISFLGLPALSLPCGFAENGLPLGMQLVGRPFAEATLLRLGHHYQQATDWHRRVPPI